MRSSLTLGWGAAFTPSTGRGSTLRRTSPSRGDLAARRVLDVGCGTGCLAILLAGAGYAVTGVDPAAASLDVARSKDGSGAVTWIHGDAAAVPAARADLAGMTGDVAQGFPD